MKGSKELLENHMVCWTQNVPYKNTFSCCCRWVCVSLWIIHYLINRPEDFVNRHWTLTSNHIRSSGNCNCHKKKLFTIFYLFCTDLIYFNRRFILVFFLFISKDTNCFSLVTIVFNCGTFWSTVQSLSLSLFSRWHLALRENFKLW